MNKELEFLNARKIPTDSFGELFVKVVLFFYDYPRCFIAKNSHEQFFILTENDDSIDSFGWNVSEVSLDDINSANKGKMDIQSLFKGNNKYLLKFCANEDICKATKIDAFEGENAILGSTFMTDFCDMDELFDFHSLQKVSNDSRRSSISLAFESDEGTKTSNVFKAINYMRTICQNLNTPLDIFNSKLTVQHASTVITFQFENSFNNSLFDNQSEFDSSNLGVIELGNLLSAQNPEQILLEAKNDIKTIKKYSKLIDTLGEESKLRPKVILSIPNRENVSSFNFSEKRNLEKKNAVSKAKIMFDENNVIQEKDILEEGVLTGILTGDKNKFSFKANNGTKYEGVVDFGLVGNDNQFLVNGAVYSSLIKETKIVNNGNVSKTTYKLLKLEKKYDIPSYKQTNLFED